MCKQKSFRSKRKSNKRGGYSLLVLLFLKSKSTGTKASYVCYVSKPAFMYKIARPASVCANRKKRGLIISFLVLKQSKYISNLQVSKTFHIPNSAVATI